MPIIRRNQAPANLWQSIKPHQSVRHFENSVIQFHNLHKTPIRQLPHVLGRRINLRKLYISVIKRGGYKKVNEKEGWDDVLNELNLPKEATNSELAIQTIYHRYLEDYERSQWNSLNAGSFNDNSNESNQLDIDFSKHSTFISELGIRDRSCLASFVYDNTPKIYSDYRHIISNMSRLESGLSCDLKEASELKHLVMSLKSGLCNEIDFALNTLLIMSSNERITLDLRFTGELLDLLIAVTGIIDIRLGSYFEQFKNHQWMKDSMKFWNKIVEDGVGRMFLVPNIFTCSKTDIKQIQRDSHIVAGSGHNDLFNDDNQYHRIIDPCCQRVHLIATILHNLAISSPVNSQTLVNNNHALRFLLLAVHSRDSVLRRLSLHTLTKLRFVLCPIQDSPDSGLKTSLFNPSIIDLSQDKEEDSEDEWFTEFLLDFLMSLLSSDNRCDRISAYEMIQSLCLIEDNHETLSKHLQNPFVVRISSQLLVPDIHPLCCALEALVALSQLGDDMCRRMAMCRSLLKCLLQFVSIEAQMFGPTAVYKIKTFNCRPPPIPVNNNYHSLRVPPPVQGPYRALAPFVTNNHNNNSSSSNNPVHSRSIHSLSRPPHPVPMSPAPAQIIVQATTQYISNHQSPQMAPEAKTPLTPFQHIDHLLTKTIASFSVPARVPEPRTETPPPIASPQITAQTAIDSPVVTAPEEDSVNNTTKITDNEEEIVKRQDRRRVVQIKCCVEGEDLDIEDINGVHRTTPLVNGGGGGGSSVNGDLQDTGGSGGGSPTDDQNGDLSGDEDPDRRQMPPPSLPTPSMLKKQLRPRLSTTAAQSPPPSPTTNGFLPQSPPSSPTLPSSLMSLSPDDRCDQVKTWLKKNFQVTDDVRMFVAKHQLVEELHDALFDLDDCGGPGDLGPDGGPAPRMAALSAQELHSCIKEIFGQKVQVKFEHGVNGNTQLIYSHLGRIESDEARKSVVTNGVIVPEMNGFVNHSTKRKLSDNDSDDEIDQKKVCEDNGEQMKADMKLTESESIDKELVVKKKVSRGRKKRSLLVASRVKLRYKSMKVAKSHMPAVHPPIFSPSNGHSINHGTSPARPAVIHNYGHLACLWGGNCPRRFTDDSSLQSHVTNDHLESASSGTGTPSSPTRTTCQWRDCPTGQIARAPLSLLSHVIQEHCTPSSSPIVPVPVPVQAQHQTTINNNNNRPSPITNYNIVTTGPSIINQCPTSLNNILSSNIRSNVAVGQSNQLLEKSGWSVLYDHYRVDEQLHSNLPEGPITKHIRISSSIILRNMSRHSIIAKEFLRSNEKYLSLVAMNNQDCSSIIVQCLDELSQQASPVATTVTTTTPAADIAAVVATEEDDS